MHRCSSGSSLSHFDCRCKGSFSTFRMCWMTLCYWRVRRQEELQASQMKALDRESTGDADVVNLPTTMELL
ncbi:hypothetical protein MPTK1_1g27320 [Marchantia polymorpha subsp. ruderalis]|uniref:Uncharacterized protein n=2 Tax=Marchantia polymorpha TaxID=3197 RepID=A0AAF6AUU2_MARPO|nr:hypothetical protein MARPO_0002s0146 [Marchantia polymorpha]BBN00213.1 hypothetical protein Mp_1g27320 [Marchantia polymorpha subsp. ruderalis]|eukprot:PTQ49671.1 hypothetical protein MARPO_0002s0146 [Marchantia polymorpha]